MTRIALTRLCLLPGEERLSYIGSRLGAFGFSTRHTAERGQIIAILGRNRRAGSRDHDRYSPGAAACALASWL
jgi:hypothetical protein